MSPTGGMNHPRAADLIVGHIAVGLQDAFELSQKLPRPIPSTSQPEVVLRVGHIATDKLDDSFLGPRASAQDEGYEPGVAELLIRR